MDLNFSSLAAGFVYGIFGIYIFNFARKRSHAGLIIIGFTLMVYPYFISNEFLLWGIGAALLFIAFRMMKLS